MTVSSTLLLDPMKLAVRNGPVKLASGKSSDYYVDVSTVAYCSLYVEWLGEVIRERTYDLLHHRHPKPLAIGGPALGAVPLVVAALASYEKHGKLVFGFAVRGEPKGHGLGAKIEGSLDCNSRVVMLDDAVTTGASLLSSIKTVREYGCEVVRVIALFDRQEGAAELMAANGVDDYRVVYTPADLFSRAKAE